MNFCFTLLTGHAIISNQNWSVYSLGKDSAKLITGTLNKTTPSTGLGGQFFQLIKFALATLIS